VDSGVAVDEVDGYALSYVIPTQADILIVYSTMEGAQRVVSRNEYKSESQRNTVLVCDWIQLNRDQWRTLVNMAMNHRVP
jgi:hypothetical protein